ncbi:D-alanyl-D-alanine carboxypeptidase/D-alanyl-D-alanine-endopeptidase (penicillin-binding protein 4) [Mucilaginibacter frigoritolerans]|jgi:serine-type D-Ala-D-Ala carboxypeptidase/endopeptidase (penicillin-binding protein 4)|uniref:D-alanyl-D-alanine carboxypeptidase/D-alanyl-D-alanine-endopeptidase (Penicillin-binding protein 4) n=1 Tax=Mucilaginibacter frigoritolerans TaxID=652788 RepID=A0A562TUF3_9SPHI|nr:D-alanyl-D-alanine carboxypeptidase [Mucilaginibacter frigoritolerans]TWI97249.1 D-alanyl-D-alanine carboxypeptidase/D-alanyl-D-alanine-endopeptidase (penicillin-binding protein 4) [Mucilaginibacter frigoritolerans]
MKRKVFVITMLISSLLMHTDYSIAGRIKRRKVKKLFKHSQLLNSHFTGFALYDLDNKKMVYAQNEDKYFTPASNTKLFTYYTCLKMLGDSIPALKYVIHGDSLIFWGTGDPSFLHSDLKGIKAFNFLKNSHKKLFFAAGNYTGDIYGDGWAWNDYNDYYQAEINELPVEDNVALLYADKNDSLQIQPAGLKKYLRLDSTYHPHSFRVRRDFVSNLFIYPVMPLPKKYRQEIPWKTSADLTVSLLQDTLKDTVRLITMPLTADAQTLYDEKADTVYKHMLQPSDNFIAEQLLLVCSSTRFKTLNADSVISYSKAHFLNDLPDAPQWVDGSGLSRQNLFTPRSIITLLCKILDEVKSDSLVHSLMPTGGIVGTIKKAYKTDNGQPFIWAKTGSLNNNYNQSGYFITRKGKRFAFSFMNNNFIQADSQVRDEMVKLITFLHDNY